MLDNAVLLTVLSIVFRITAILGYVLSMTYYMHMFQLNSYKASVQMKWLRENFIGGYLVRVVPAVISLAASFFGAIGLIIAILANISFFIRNLPVKAKKPLVFTARVKRMIATFLILSVLIIVPVSYFTGMLFIYSAILLLPCFIILVANFLNKPIEKAVGNHYINEAKAKINALPNLIVIGITGSYGKTSTKFYLQKLLSSKYNVLMTPESYNTTMGVVKTVREQLDATYDIFICEMGAKNVGEIKEICDIVKPKYGIITSIGPAHLESFKSMENIVKTKFELCDALPDDGIIFLNGDNEYIAKHTPSRKAVYYGTENKELEKVFGDNISVSDKGTSFTAHTEADSYDYDTKILGKHSVVNILGCIAMARFLGCDAKQLVLPVKRLETAPHRLQLRPGNEVTIIDDAFNSNPSGSRAALDVLGAFSGVKIMITPGMVELGDMEDKYNCEFGEYAAQKCDYVLLVGERITKSIAKGLENKNYPKDRYFTFAKVTEAIAFANGLEAGKKKYVLLENDLPDNY
ncbi:MAG: UDP-N-acetylmuramoyl-tripeptide--D-alanyl-D-alanine ligase [Ruminococcaceae bacterium]|nr:UDP-N-acetylmuramoyl-tripeptide--D-alanyl-D-alanine ligase [Oscillospiraceae bacterium]